MHKSCNSTLPYTNDAQKNIKKNKLEIFHSEHLFGIVQVLLTNMFYSEYVNMSVITITL